MGTICTGAEDAAQTVFRKVMEYDKPFRDLEHEKAWLTATARNGCRDRLKRWWRNRLKSEEALHNLAWEQPRDGELREFILKLPEKYQMVLYLHYYREADDRNHRRNGFL